MSRLCTFLAILWILATSDALAKPQRTAPKIAVDASSTKTVDQPLRVQGQSRNLSMTLTLKNKSEPIQYIQVRRDYRPEVRQTPY